MYDSVQSTSSGRSEIGTEVQLETPGNELGNQLDDGHLPPNLVSSASVSNNQQQVSSLPSERPELPVHLPCRSPEPSTPQWSLSPTTPFNRLRGDHTTHPTSTPMTEAAVAKLQSTLPFASFAPGYGPFNRNIGSGFVARPLIPPPPLMTTPNALSVEGICAPMNVWSERRRMEQTVGPDSSAPSQRLSAVNNRGSPQLELNDIRARLDRLELVTRQPAPPMRVLNEGVLARLASRVEAAEEHLAVERAKVESLSDENVKLQERIEQLELHVRGTSVANMGFEEARGCAQPSDDNEASRVGAEQILHSKPFDSSSMPTTQYNIHHPIPHSRGDANPPPRRDPNRSETDIWALSGSVGIDISALKKLIRLTAHIFLSRMLDRVTREKGGERNWFLEVGEDAKEEAIQDAFAYWIESEPGQRAIRTALGVETRSDFKITLKDLEDGSGSTGSVYRQGSGSTSMQGRAASGL